MRRLASLLLIRPGEGRHVIYFFLLFVTIGAGMALGRGTTDALFFKRYGIEYLPIMFVLVSVLLAGVSVLYAAFVDLIPAERFFKILFGILAASLGLNWAGMMYGASDLVYPAYFLLYEVSSELLLVHGALYLSQNLVQVQSKRLLPLILAGHQIGVIVGGLFLVFASKALGVHNLLLVWAVLAVTSLLLLRQWHRQRGISPYFRAARRERSRIRQSVTQVRQGVQLLGTSPLLKWASIGLFFMVIAVYVLSYSVNWIYTQRFETEESLSAFFGMLTAVTSGTALLLQIFVTNRVIRRFGIKRVNLIFPVTTLLSFVALFATFSLPAAILGSLNKDALMPAFRNPVRNLFMTALPSQVQGRARATSIVVVIPLALLVAGLFLLGTREVENMIFLALVGMLTAAGYLFFNHRMNGAYVREVVENLRRRLFVSEQQMHELAFSRDERVMRDIERGLMHEDDEISLAYARVLRLAAPERAAQLFPRRFETAGTVTRDQLVQMLRPLGPEQLRDHLRAAVGSGDAHLDATLLMALFEVGDEAARAWVPRLLQRDEPRLRAVGVYGALRYPVIELEATALDVWEALLRDHDLRVVSAGIGLIRGELASYHGQGALLAAGREAAVRLLACDEAHLIRIALDALQRWPAESGSSAFAAPLARLFAHTDATIRNACLRCVHLLPPEAREHLLAAGIDDAHPQVRATAVRVMVEPHPDRIGVLHRYLTGSEAASPRAQEAAIDHLIEIGAPAEVMFDVSRAKAADARRMREARRLLERQSTDSDMPARLLRYVLDERTHQFIDLALLALQSSDADQGIVAIRAGLQSQDARQISAACDLLTHLGQQEIARMLLPLFEEDEAGDGKRPAAFASLEALLHWGRERRDPWLRECMTHCAHTMRR